MTMPDALDDVMGAAEIADFLDVRPRTVDQWKWLGLLPPPDKELARVDLWRRSTIREWALETGRLPLEDNDTQKGEGG